MSQVVIDASALAEALLGTSQGREVLSAIGGDNLVAPAHLAVEVSSVARGWLRSGEISEAQAASVLQDFLDTGIDIVPLEVLISTSRVWWPNISAYDAPYVDLAQRLDCDLLTLDQRLVRAIQGRVKIRSVR